MVDMKKNRDVLMKQFWVRCEESDYCFIFIVQVVNRGVRMTVEEVLTNTGASGYANKNWSNVRIYIHGVMFKMQKKYLHCEVEDYRPEYGFDYDTGEIDFDNMYVAIDLRC